MNVTKATEIAKTMLSEKRFMHSLNVAEKAKELAQLYGADISKAELAGVLHDIMKEQSKTEMLEAVKSNKTLTDWLLQYPVNVWHGPVAAEYLKKVYNIEDDELLSAICCHTFGKAQMSKLDKIVYIADLVSIERDYPNVQTLRCIANSGLDNALLFIMKEHAQILVSYGKTPMPQTLGAIKVLEESGKQSK